MSKIILVCICVVAWALAGCNQNVYLEEETPPGKVPPKSSAPVSAAPDADLGAELVIDLVSPACLHAVAASPAARRSV